MMLYGVWLLDWENQTLLSIFTERDAAEAELARLTALNKPTPHHRRALGYGALEILEHELDKPCDVEVRSWEKTS